MAQGSQDLGRRRPSYRASPSAFGSSWQPGCGQCAAGVHLALIVCGHCAECGQCAWRDVNSLAHWWRGNLLGNGKGNSLHGLTVAQGS
jgi:hypothetical protein